MKHWMCSFRLTNQQPDYVTMVHHIRHLLLLPLQELRYAVWDTATRSQACSGVLPLSPRATLTWLAFSEQGTLCAMDSEGCAHVVALDADRCLVELPDGMRLAPAAALSNSIDRSVAALHA